jgi:hypothetical protein
MTHPVTGAFGPGGSPELKLDGHDAMNDRLTVAPCADVHVLNAATMRSENSRRSARTPMMNS